MPTRAASSDCVCACRQMPRDNSQQGGAWRSVLLSAVSGAFAALGHAPFDWPLCTIIGLSAAFHLILQSDRPRIAGVRAWALGVGYFGVTLSWLIEPFMVDADRHGWMAPFALFFMAAGLASFWAMAAGLAHRLSRVSFRWIALAAALTAAELLRARLFTGFPWGNPGHVWIDTPFAQLAAYVGANGLGALTFVLAALFAHILSRALGSREQVVLSASAIVIGGTALLVGQMRAAMPLPENRDVTIRLVQPNAPQHLKWDPRYAFDFVQRQIDYTSALPQQSNDRPDVVIWPETAVPTLLEWTEELRDEMAAAAQGSAVVFGVQRGDGVQYYNSLAVLNAGGDIVATYDKHHLVPFGEYIPLGNWLENFGISAFAARAGNGYSAGPSAQLLDLGVAGTALPLICYEAIFPRDIFAAPKRADWILHATNDAWFGAYSMPFQHLAQARLRAIEFGLPVVRVANTGISAIVSARGQVLDSIALGKAGYLDAQLPEADHPTLYSRTSDWPLVLLMTVILLTLSISQRFNSTQKRVDHL